MEEKTMLASQYILKHLNVEPDAKVEAEYGIDTGNQMLRIDYLINSRDSMILIEVKPRINEETIYKINTYSQILNNQLKNHKKLRMVCIGRAINYAANYLASILGVEILLIPREVLQDLTPTEKNLLALLNRNYVKKTPSKITSEKFWKVICSIIKDKPFNILSISKNSGVSYGWTNMIVHKLLESKIIDRKYGITLKH